MWIAYLLTKRSTGMWLVLVHGYPYSLWGNTWEQKSTQLHTQIHTHTAFVWRWHPQNSCCKPNVQCDDIRRWGLWEIFRSWGWSPQEWRLLLLQRELTEVPSSFHHVRIQWVPYIGIFKLPTFKDSNLHSRFQSHKLVHVSGGHCHMCASSTSGCTFVHFRA